LAVASFEALERIGMPEGRIVLGHVVAYLALAAKSRATYDAINSALAIVTSGTHISVPMHLRNYPPQHAPNSYSGYLPENLQDVHLFRDNI
jgi:putative ATPase